MDKTRIALDVLTGKDHQVAMAIIYWLESCHTRKEFNQVIEAALIPLLNCCGVFYVGFKNKGSTPQLLGSINQPLLCHHKWQGFLITAMGANIVAKRNPNSMNFHQINDSCTMMELFDTPKQTVAIYFCCLNSKDMRYNQRNIELLKILRATLLQTIKVILSREGCKNQQQIMGRRFEQTEPLAVVSDDGILIHKNSVYDQIVEKVNCTFLATIFSQENSIKLRKTESYCLLSQLGTHLYEITLMLVNQGTNQSTSLYLLRFSRITNKTEEIISQLNKAGLTKRELEITTLIYQGINTRDISEKINLSYHTVRNHIKSIYSKLGVSSRSEMLVWMG